jgi:hypothetical protein
VSDNTQPYAEKVIAELLALGEEASVPVRFTVPRGKFRYKSPPDPPMSAPKKTALIAASVIVDLLGGANPPSLAKMLGMVSAEGHTGSVAHQVFTESRAPATETTFAALTRDTLLIIVVRKAGTDPRKEVLRIPRAQVTRARLRGRNLVKLRFADKSRIKLKLDMTTPDLAHGFTRELWPNAAVR